MDSSLTFGRFLGLSFLLFSMFLGAGNIIFSPPLGQAAGTNIWVAMSGFFISGVGLVLLAIIALAKSESIESLAGRVGSKFSKLFCILLFLALGPFYVVPRTASVVHEISILPLLPTSFPLSEQEVLLGFTTIFMLATIYLCLEPKKFVSRIGGVITPTLLILLIIILTKSILTPIGPFGTPTGPYIDHAFGYGFTQGYYTMDVLAAFVFGKIFLDAARYSGISDNQLSRVFIQSGIFAMCALGLVQVSLAAMGASSVSVIGISRNGGEALPLIINLLLGQVGVVMFACTIFLTGWTTAIACLAAVAEYFSRAFPKITYKKWVVIFGIMSLVIANFGLARVLTLASPVLVFLYPIAITLIALVFLNKWFNGKQAVYIGAVSGAAIMGVFDGMKDIKILPNSILEWLTSYVPLYVDGLGWIIFALIGGVLGLLCSKTRVLAGNSFQNSKI
ncbi:TPA: branched-chain amino acid transport system II carrier protein [Acinetobacter baumannii]|nr:branched-chain amino acid transport system II carrier protein [Acinetobacter baumannii]